MNHFDKHLNTAAAHVVLTDAEKDAIRAALSRAMAGGVPSPYQRYLYVSQRVLAGVLILLVVGSGTALASEGALPGGILYAVKINVTEPVEGALRTTAASRADWHAALAERRMQEAETLASEGKLTPADATLIAANFNRHANAVAELAPAVAAQDPSLDGTLPTKVAATLQAHSEVLLALSRSASTTPDGHAALSLATDVSSRAKSLMEFPDQAGGASSSAASPSLQAEGSKQPGGSRSGSARAVLMVATSGTSTPALSHASGTATGTAAASSTASSSVGATGSSTRDDSGSASTLKRSQLKRLRDAAAGQIANLQEMLASQEGSLSADARGRVVDELARANAALAQGDSAQDARSAAADYSDALRLSLFLGTYLTANAQFPDAHLLPALLDEQLKSG